MRDPLLITNEREPPEKRLPDEQKLIWYGSPDCPVPRAPEKLAGDLIRAFDDLHDLRRKFHRSSDAMLAEIIQTRKDLQWANRMIWIAALIISPIVSEVVKWVLKQVF